MLGSIVKEAIEKHKKSSEEESFVRHDSSGKGRKDGGMGSNGGSYVKWFSELSNKDIAVAGGKGASLAEMYNNKLPIPPGFVITSEAYKYYMQKNNLQETIMTILKETDVDDVGVLSKNASKIRELVENAEMPSDLKSQILDAYDVLDIEKKNFSKASESAMDILRTGHEPPFVAVRSSATTEDLVDASFAGQQETFLNVKGQDALIKSVKKAFASLFTDRAIYYRAKKGFMHENSYLAVVVQKMIDSDKSGVIFSRNPVKDDGNIIIEAVFGLGEGVVSGKISPDYYVVNQELELVDSKISDKKIALTRNSSGKTESVNLKPGMSKREVLNGHEIRILGHYAKKLEKHYGKPQDIEFAISDEIYIVQSRPITTKVKKSDSEVEGNVLVKGSPASPGIASGVVKIVHEISELGKIQKGNILVTKMTNPDMVVSMQKAAGIITDEGGLTSHASIVSREMGIPAVVGTGNATEKLQDGQVVTVDGYTGKIIEGKGVEKKVEIKKAVETSKVKLKLIVDLPDYAERAAESGIKSIGLVRLEGIIATSGKHPVWFIKNGRLKEYISNLSDGLKKMARYFDEIWVRSSDVRSDEYGNLDGAPKKQEQNPMLGDHGIRFSLKNQDLLEAEFKAVKELADEYSNKKFGIMLPQVISVYEVSEAKKMALKVNFPENVKLGVMIETPASVQIINDLCGEGIDFVSFGTNDLTQYTLAIDRNNEDIQELYDEMNPAVLNSLAHVIKTCRKYGVETSICGQAGSRKEMIEFLMKEGIDSISVNADAAYEASMLLSGLEGKSGSVSNKVSEEVVKEEKTGSKPEKDVKDEEQKEHVTAEKKLEIPIIANENIDEEEAILKALDDGNGISLDEGENEYEPSLQERRDDVPSLNEAIPVSSEVFEDAGGDGMKDENFVDFYNQEVEKDLADSENSGYDNETDGKEGNLDANDLDNNLEEDSEEDFERLPDDVFKAEVEEEIAESEVREQVKKQFGSKQEWKKDKKSSADELEDGGEEVLDIF